MSRWFNLSFAALVLWACAVTWMDKALEAEVHLRKACEAVWPDAAEDQIDRCTKRAMAAMGDDNRLLDNELKRLLMACERELEACKAGG